MEKIEHNQQTIDNNTIICNKCNTFLHGESLINCVICKNEFQRKLTVLFDKKKYTLLGKNTVQVDQIPSLPVRSYICKECLSQLQPCISCVSCHLNVNQHLSKLYKMDENDFSQYIVSQCLPDVNAEEDNKFISLSCHKKLQETNDENAFVPYHVKNNSLTSAANFLKALQDKPKYVCSCCHRMMFYKTV